MPVTHQTTRQMFKVYSNYAWIMSVKKQPNLCGNEMKVKEEGEEEIASCYEHTGEGNRVTGFGWLWTTH